MHLHVVLLALVVKPILIELKRTQLLTNLPIRPKPDMVIQGLGDYPFLFILEEGSSQLVLVDK